MAIIPIILGIAAIIMFIVLWSAVKAKSKNKKSERI
jgi:hypothetical protein